MFNLMLSCPLADGRFIISNTELATIEPSKLEGIEMKMITPPCSGDIQYLKDRFNSKYRMIMENWSELIPSEDTPSEIAQMIRTLSEFAKERIKYHEHKFIMRAMFVNDVKSQVMFSQFFGKEAVHRLYVDGYFDPFGIVGIHSTDVMAKIIGKSIKNPPNASDPFRAVCGAMAMLIVKNQFTEWCSAS